MTREEIIEQLESIVGTYEILLGHGVNSDILDVDDIEAIKEAISALSENKGEPKTGRWILTSDDECEYCTCSECGYQNGENWMIGSHIKFCQECGADMRGET